MPTEPTDFRDQLVGAQQMTPSLRDGYRKELDAILYETHTARSRLPGILLLVVCLAVVAAEVRALLIHHGGPTFYVGAFAMLAACATGAAWLARDLLRGRSLRRQSLKFPDLFYGASSLLLVAQLLHGLRAPGDPASTFGVLFVFAFFAVCTNWSFSSRITAAELAFREETLRIECRLADLADRLPR